MIRGGLIDSAFRSLLSPSGFIRRISFVVDFLHFPFPFSISGSCRIRDPSRPRVPRNLEMRISRTRERQRERTPVLSEDLSLANLRRAAPPDKSDVIRRRRIRYTSIATNLELGSAEGREAGGREKDRDLSRERDGGRRVLRRGKA